MFPEDPDLGDQDRVLRRMLDEVARDTRPLMVVIDDAHWADEASLDVVRYLGRRAQSLPLVLVIAFRRGELADDHPMQRVLGALSGSGTHRIELAGLSQTSLDLLAARAGVEPSRLAGLDGNPFLVTEILASPETALPATVRDAIVGRLSLLDPAERKLLRTLAVIPRAADLDLLEAMFPDTVRLLERPELMGLVRISGSHVAFRHEIARLAVEAAMPDSRRLVLHRRVLNALEKRGDDPSVLLHHAVGGIDAASIARHAPVAARAAAQAEAHREALAASRLALGHAELLTVREIADLHGLAARAAYVLNRHVEAAEHAREAVATWARIDAAASEMGHALLVSARMQTMIGEPRESRRLAVQGLEVLRPHGRSVGLAEAHELLASIRSIAGDNVAAIESSHAAIAIARAVGHREVESRAGIHLGLALAGAGDPAAAITVLERSVAELGHLDSPEYEGRAANTLSVVLIWLGRHPEALPYLDLADRIAREHGMELVHYHVASLRANVQIFQGDWDLAESTLRELLSEDRGGALRSLPMAYLGRLLLRRGDTDADELIDGAYELAAASGQIRRIAPAGAARLERAWLAGEIDRVRRLSAELIEIATRGHLVHLHGEVLRYLRRCGLEATAFDGCPDGFAAGIAGDWARAAAAWEHAGNPYEQALELIEAPDATNAVAGVALLDRLGAWRTAAFSRRTLRSRSVTRIPRQVRRTRAGNRLTARQAEILDMVAQGLSSPEIAAQLHLSRRTVDNHVAGIMAALEVTSRRAAVAAVRASDGPADDVSTPLQWT